MRLLTRSALAAVAAGLSLALIAPAALAGGPNTGGPNPDGSAAAAATPGAAVTTATAVPAGFPVNGLDVSSHDHSGSAGPNWSSLHSAGNEFAYVKATEGTGYANPYYSGDYNGAKNAGMYAGAYAFARPDLGNAVGQADYFVDHIEWATDGKTLPPFLDLEWPYGSLGLPTCYGLGQGAMVNWISSFLGEVRSRIGRAPAIYTNVNWWNPCTGSSAAFSAYPLDIASCDSSAPSVPGWGKNWTFWQYDIDACGRGAPYDSDVFNGSVADLAALAGGSGGANAVVSGDVTGDGHADMIARKPDGTLMMYANTGSNTAPYTSGTQIGSGWSGFSWFLAGDVTGDGRADVVGDRADGTLWLYANSGSATSPFGSGAQIGSSWGQFSNVTLGDVTGDDRADLVAKRSDGTLWLYANSGSATSPYTSGTQVGSGWTGFNRVLAGDVTGDGHADLVATKADGTLWLYANSGSTTAPYTSGTQIGSGWQGFNRVTAADVTGDGHADLVATKADGTLWLYANSGSTTAPYGSGAQIGSGWQNFA
jgi:GH25 family lysozyme M1 (1,4-beta-N-acetylmuramidase)